MMVLNPPSRYADIPFKEIPAILQHLNNLVGPLGHMKVRNVRKLGVSLIPPNGKLIRLRSNSCNNSFTQRLLPLRKLLRGRKTGRLERLGTLRALMTLPFNKRNEGLILIIHEFDQLRHGRITARRGIIGVIIVAATTATVPPSRGIVATRCARFLLLLIPSIGLFSILVRLVAVIAPTTPVRVTVTRRQPDTRNHGWRTRRTQWSGPSKGTYPGHIHRVSVNRAIGIHVRTPPDEHVMRNRLDRTEAVPHPSWRSRLTELLVLEHAIMSTTDGNWHRRWSLRQLSHGLRCPRLRSKRERTLSLRDYLRTRVPLLLNWFGLTRRTEVRMQYRNRRPLARVITAASGPTPDREPSIM